MLQPSRLFFKCCRIFLWSKITPEGIVTSTQVKCHGQRQYPTVGAVSLFAHVHHDDNYRRHGAVQQAGNDWNDTIRNVGVDCVVHPHMSRLTIYCRNHKPVISRDVEDLDKWLPVYFKPSHLLQGCRLQPFDCGKVLCHYLLACLYDFVIELAIGPLYSGHVIIRQRVEESTDCWGVSLVGLFVAVLVI